MKYDLVILGGGPAGYPAALKAAELGKSVALIEKSFVGGTCLNRGCIPTKALLHSADLYSSRTEWAELGVNADATFDEGAIYAHKDKIVETLRSGIRSMLKAGKVAYIEGEGKFVSPHSIAIGEEIVEGDNILVAVGSSPAKLPIKGIEYALNSDDVLSAPVEGNNIVVIGGGVIGMEFTSYFAGLGKTVTVVEATDRILPMFGKEISVQLSSVMKKKGVSFVTSAKVVEISETSVTYEKNGSAETIPCDAVIVAIGRKANIKDIGLENAGVETDGRFICTDEKMRTSAAGVYAVGDCNGKVQLAHFATASAYVALADMYGYNCDIDLSVVPSCVYTSPEVAMVGETDFEGAKVGKFLLGGNGKSLINGSNRGFIKLICDDKGIVRGGELFGYGVTELVAEIALAVKNHLTAEDIATTIHAHPTMYESIFEAAQKIKF